MAQYIFTMNRVGKVVPPKRYILRDISLSFFPGAKIGVLGLNGSGKSSLLKIMAGVDDNYEGEVIRMPGIRVGYLEQEPLLQKGKSVRDVVEESMGDTAAAKKRLDEIYAAYSEPDADFDKLAEEQAKLEAMVNAGGADQMEVAADALRLPDWNSKIENLSGGEKRRVALCRLLLSKPDLLLLDEPTNHLDAESVEWLEQFLQRFPGTVVAVTHDRYFLDNAAGWILELDRGRGIPWEGNYSSWLEQKEKRLEVEQSQEAARIKSMQAELEWVRQNPQGRRTKSKARLARFEELSQYEHQQRNETQEIFIPVAERLGNEVIEFKGVSKGYGERLLLDKLSFKVPAGAIVGIIGPNGAGKSTLFKLITQKETPDAGKVTWGHDTSVGYFAQDHHEAIEPGYTAYDWLYRFDPTAPKEHVRSVLGKLLFSGEAGLKKTENLSGGEAARLFLAKLILVKNNVVVLDEPTNHLDVESLEWLERELTSLDAAVVLVAHDRWFLEAVTTAVLELGGPKPIFFDGPWHAWRREKAARASAAARAPSTRGGRSRPSRACAAGSPPRSAASGGRAGPRASSRPRGRRARRGCRPTRPRSARSARRPPDARSSR